MEQPQDQANMMPSLRLQTENDVQFSASKSVAQLLDARMIAEALLANKNRSSVPVGSPVSPDRTRNGLMSE